MYAVILNKKMILSSKEKKEKLKEVEENFEKLEGSKKVIMMQLMS